VVEGAQARLRHEVHGRKAGRDLAEIGFGRADDRDLAAVHCRIDHHRASTTKKGQASPFSPGLIDSATRSPIWTSSAAASTIRVIIRKPSSMSTRATAYESPLEG